MNYRNLFILLKKRGIKRTDLVRNGVLTAGSLIRLRNNQPVSLYTLDRLSVYLDCDILELMERDLPGPEGG